MNTKTIGDIAVANVMATLVGKGKTILIPWGDNERYDLVIDQKEEGFLRVQCKNGRARNGTVTFSTTSTQTGKNGILVQDYSADEIDAFGVYCALLGKVYIVPLKDAGKGETRLRLEPTKNNQEKNIRWAKDYEI